MGSKWKSETIPQSRSRAYVGVSKGSKSETVIRDLKDPAGAVKCNSKAKRHTHTESNIAADVAGRAKLLSFCRSKYSLFQSSLSRTSLSGEV